MAIHPAKPSVVDVYWHRTVAESVVHDSVLPPAANEHAILSVDELVVADQPTRLHVVEIYLPRSTNITGYDIQVMQRPV